MDATAARPCIMVVEDEQDVRTGFKDLLEHEGYTVLEARDGAEALEKLRSMRPAVVLADMIMPEMNGLRFCKEVKNDVDLASIPIILVSATVTDGAFASCGAAAHFQKPVDVSRLLALLAELTGKEPIPEIPPRDAARPHAAPRAVAP